MVWLALSVNPSERGWNGVVQNSTSLVNAG